MLGNFVLDIIAFMFLRERGILTASALSGIVFAGCTTFQEPDFPSCDIDDSDKSAEHYLREGKFGINRGLRIGKICLVRNPKTGEILLKEGEHKDVINPESLVVIPEQSDGREYALHFEEHEKYVEVNVESKCTNASISYSE